MRTVRYLRWSAFAMAAGLAAGTALSQDSLGGFDQAYTNGGNLFGHGAWGNGDGTALPLPGPQAEFGFYFGRPYDGGNNLFGTGFWSAEYMVRRGETLSRVSEVITEKTVIEGGPLGDGYAGDGKHGAHGSHDGKGRKTGMKGHGGKDDGHGKGGYDKGGHDKGGKDHGSWGRHDKHMKPREKTVKVFRKVEKTIEKTRTRYIPYARREVVLVPRSYSDIVVIERPRTVELGDIRVTERARVETFGAVCITGKGDEVAAIVVTDRGADAAYEGEIFRCPGDTMLRVSYATGAAEIIGSVRLEDGTSYKDCDAGDALVRTGSGELACAPKRGMDRARERALAARYGDADAAIASGGAAYEGGEAVDLTGLELSGGVGNTGGAY